MLVSYLLQKLYHYGVIFVEKNKKISIYSSIQDYVSHYNKYKRVCA